MSRMEPLIELCDLIAQNPAKLMGKLAWICDRCPVAEILLIGKVSKSELNAILAVARFLSRCPNHSDEIPKSLVLVFYRSIPSSLNPAFWPQSFTNDSIGDFFCNFFEYIVKACEFSPEFSADVSVFTADILISVIGYENADRGISKAILKAMSHNCPPVVPSDANKLVSGLLEMIIRSPEGKLRTSSHTSSSVGNVGLLGGSSGYNDTEKHAIASFEEEPVDVLEKREMTLKLIGNVLNKVSIDANLLENVRGTVKRQLQLMVAFLKTRKRDWSEQGKSLKVRINAIFAADQAATRLHINTLASLDLAGKSSERLLHESLALLIEAAEACLFSVWRKLRACEELFSTLVSGICQVAVVHDGQMLQFLFSWFKHLVLSTCARANTWGSNQGAMFENVLSKNCEINQSRQDNAHSRLYTFITSSLERNCSEEEVEKQKQAAPSLLLNSLMLLADLNVSVKRPEVVAMVLPFFH